MRRRLPRRRVAADDFAARPDARRFDIDGKVISVDKAARQITLAHDEVKGFMDAMTMPFRVKEAWAFDAAAPGDTLRGTLVVDGARAWVEGVNVDARPIPPPRCRRRRPRGPRPIPARPCLMSRSPIRTAGRCASRAGAASPYLLTFSYTRCPLEEFCPLMMQRFAAIEKATAKDPGPRRRAARDRHARSRARYAGAVARVRREVRHRARPAEPFSRWSLVTGTPAQIKPLAGFFGLDYYTESTGQVIHSLRTAIIDRDGRVAKVFESNTWKTDEVLEALRAATPPAS